MVRKESRTKEGHNRTRQEAESGPACPPAGPALPAEGPSGL